MAQPPRANAAAPEPPAVAAFPQAPPPPIGIAAPVLGVAQAIPAGLPKRPRIPRGPVIPVGDLRQVGAPALLELSAALPMHTEQRREPNTFVPDTNFLFHVLSICDSLMNTTARFTQSNPAWIPIISQLYISVLWVYQIMFVYSNSGYGTYFNNLLLDLRQTVRIDECPIPGPLVPFFESIAAINGPFAWIGDISPTLPQFHIFWNSEDWIPESDFLRSVPIPAVLLDQLNYFSTWTVPANQTLYGNFEWYRNIFTEPATNNVLSSYRIAPQCSGSLFTTEIQTNTARTFWNAFFRRYQRDSSDGHHPTYKCWDQLLGLQDQDGTVQLEWFQHVATIMAKYCQYFNGSVTIKHVSPTGLGSSMIVGHAQNHRATRNWLYPSPIPPPFLSSQFSPAHEIPTRLRLDFSHSDHEIEEIAEQYAILCATNIKWSPSIRPQHDYDRIVHGVTHLGSIWDAPSHRRVYDVNLKNQYAQLIAFRYHQVVALRSE